MEPENKEEKDKACASSSQGFRNNDSVKRTSELIQLEREMNLLDALAFSRKTTELVDMTIMCGNESYLTHKVILASGSQYFYKLFQVKPKLNRITIKELGSVILEIFLEFIYSGHLELVDMTEPLLGEALVCLKTLELSHMDRIGRHLLQLYLSEKNFFKMWELVHLLNFADLEINIIRYVFRNLEICAQQFDFYRLSLSQMTSLLSCSGAGVRHSPKVLRHVIIHWYKYNVEMRKKYLPSLFAISGLVLPDELRSDFSRRGIQSGIQKHRSLQALVKSQTPKASIPTLSSFEKPKPDVTTPVTCTSNKSSHCTFPLTDHYHVEMNRLKTLPRKKYQSSTSVPDFCCFPDRQHLMWSSKPPIRPVAPARERTVFPTTSEDTLYHFSTSNDVLAQKALPSEEQKHSNGSYSRPVECIRRQISDHLSQTSSRSDITLPLFRQSNILIVCIGNEKKVVLCCFDVIDELWTKHQPVDLPLAENSSLLLYDNFLYVLGGEKKQNKLNSVYMHDLRSGLTTKGPSLIVARSTAGFVLLHGQMFAIGGIGKHSQALTQVEMLPTERSSWQSKAPLRTARKKPSVTIAFGKIYTMGGFPEASHHAYRSCECYSVAMNQWTEIASLPEAFADTRAILSVRRDSIYALRAETPTQLFRYSAVENDWSEKGSLSVRIRGQLQSAVFVRSNLWIFSRSGNIYEYNVERDSWRSVTALPSSTGIVLNSFLIEKSIYQVD